MRVVLGSIPSAGLFLRISWLVHYVYIIKNDRDIDFFENNDFFGAYWKFCANERTKLCPDFSNR
jgi:hypothetical protein